MNLSSKLSLKLIFMVAFRFAPSYQQSCSAQSNSDINLPNLAVNSGQPLQNCCNICKNTGGCKGFAWNNYQGGTCWLKAGSGPIISNPGVSVGILDDSSNSGCSSGSGCWWSGCQPNSWAQKGCFPSNRWQQTDTKPCNNGLEYCCCPVGGSSTPPSTGPILGTPTPASTGICSWYGANGEIPPGSFTASGAIFDRNAMAAAHKTLAFGTRIRVKNDNTQQTVDVTVNDRGPFVPGRILDLTYAAFGDIANRGQGTIPCSFIILGT